MKKHTVIPLVIQVVDKAIATTDNCSVAVSREFGKILDGLRSCLTPNDILWFLNCFKALASKGLGHSLSDKASEISQVNMCKLKFNPRKL